MEFITYLITLIIAYLGVLGGFALTLIAPEELKAGERYANFARSVFYILMLLLLLYLKEPAIGIIVIIAIGMHIKFSNESMVVKLEYGVLGVILALFSKDSLMLSIAASLIFLYGLAVGICCVIKHPKKSKRWQIFYMLGTNALFFVTALPLYFFNL